MERDVAEARPAKRRREGQRNSDIEEESDSGYHSSYHDSRESGDYQNYHPMMLEDRRPWTKSD
eukprot:8220460-Heterocapsa_arctica.AAC.1